MRPIARIIADDGLSGLFTRCLSYAYKYTFRPLLPRARPVRYAGISITLDRRVFDQYVPLLCVETADIDDYEEKLVVALKRYVRSGDRVVVVGGGWGVTAALAAQLCGRAGSVVCFEGSADGVSKVLDTVSLNGVSLRVTVVHAVVGVDRHVYGSSVRGYTINPASLPMCEILQLDCEGAELLIIQDMLIRPATIIVETHGVYGATSANLVSTLERIGYEVEDLGVAESRSEGYCLANDVRVIVGTRTVG